MKNFKHITIAQAIEALDDLDDLVRMSDMQAGGLFKTLLCFIVQNLDEEQINRLRKESPDFEFLEKCYWYAKPTYATESDYDG